MKIEPNELNAITKDADPMNAKATRSSMETVCRICGTLTQPHLDDIRGYDLHRCPECSFVQVAQQPSQQDLDAIYQESYFSHSKYRDEKALEVENRRRLKFIESHVPEGSHLLEAGCGDGSFLQVAKDRYQVQGFDLSAVGVEIAKKNNPELADRIWVGHLEDQDIPKQSLDAICMWDVIEHLWMPYQVGQQLLEYLKPGGILAISTPNIGSRLAKLMGKRWAFMTPPEHLSFFSQQSMIQLFEQELNAQLIEWRTLGKRTNFGFIVYKLGRVFPFIPKALTRAVANSPLAKLPVYVPSGDIQYLLVRKG
jgi:2-polyprenyl-3-methyl-5-hydroxy-6-metoxy-1,4-benzoquinol methylase/DNA-directed RNA polymerase subunit RPC12/RpoP